VVRTSFALLAVVGLTACGDAGTPAPAPTAQVFQGAPTPQVPPSLDALAAQFQAARKAGDASKATALAYSLVPSKAELATLVRPGDASEAWLAAMKFVDVPLTDPAVADLGRQLFDPEDPKFTETRVHAATTEELVAYAAGTAAFDEFPGGMRRFAAIAAPGRTWDVVEHVEPGGRLGMKYTCFTRVGARFIFVPKPWRFLPK
jgi:hypothetical protein